MNEFSLIKNTGQWPKLITSFWILILGGAFMGIGILGIQNSSDIGHLFLSLGSFIGLIGVIIACVFVRCPHCKTPWVWLAVSKQSPGRWYQWLMELGHCPTCKNEGI